MEIKCRQCGKELEVQTKNPKRERRYCDLDCYLKANQKKKIKRCYCGKVFWATNTKADKIKYCSLRCRYRAMTKRTMTGKCEWCHWLVIQTRTRRKKFCSMQCRKEYLHFNNQPNYDQILFS